MMLSLVDIKDWLKKINTISLSEICDELVEYIDETEIQQLLESETIIAENFYIGKLDNKKEKSIGVYQLKISDNQNIALGGIDNTKSMEKSVSILIHWNTNANETEQKAYELYYKLFYSRNFEINNKKVNFIKLLVPEPVDVGTDDNNVYERVIQATFYYEKESE